MTANYGDHGAKIYQFPKGGRAALRTHREGDVRGMERAAATPVIYDGGWYHDAAIREEREGPRKQ